MIYKINDMLVRANNVSDACQLVKDGIVSEIYNAIKKSIPEAIASIKRVGSDAIIQIDNLHKLASENKEKIAIALTAIAAIYAKRKSAQSNHIVEKINNGIIKIGRAFDKLDGVRA